MKLIGALYLVWVVCTTALGAFLGMGAFLAISGHGATRHPWLSGMLHVVLFGVLFFQGLLIHLRVPSGALVGLGSLIIVGILLAGLHFLM